jgi:hypothetical protein
VGGGGDRGHNGMARAPANDWGARLKWVFGPLACGLARSGIVFPNIKVIPNLQIQIHYLSNVQKY